MTSSPEKSSPRVLSLDRFSFNFRIDRAAAVRARMGAPAFALRRKRLDRSLEAFWLGVQRRYDALWIAAGEGRIAEDGREIRQSLLRADGSDPIGGREHRRVLYRQRVDEDVAQREAFGRAWTVFIDNCGIESLVAEIEAYNRYFPVEANLKTDPKTGRFLWMGTLWDPMVAPTRADVLARFPHR